MEVNQHLALRGFSAHFIVVVDQQLIVPLHKIDFEPLDTPLLVLVEALASSGHRMNSRPAKE